ncbi:hypothetical protein UAY_03401 [Enterococcus moraviensis ATCC BAA-383]|uniref:DUF1433 domain-containing protein n=2 Tax=Enterococcus moraviensis TaxID=155617 RepID=R2SQX6_9ENTE|nr:hypothetical protein [Enterococcus moraviensis]EOH95211.1 hypothetical protein UAY_03401 [Enterococcus moraviensis ATCC BAA-383]EOT65141.1 hypothetical protein I586_02875 [Enterococcus moraviensis ATCC BAA-383]
MNKRIIILVGIIAIVLIGFGGKLYMDKKAEETAMEEQRDLLETERESAIVLKQTFANIKSVEFKKTSYNKMTGAYRMFVKLITSDNEAVEFTYSFWKERDEIGSYGIENRNAQVKGVTTKKIIVHYSNREEDKL